MITIYNERSSSSSFSLLSSRRIRLFPCHPGCMHLANKSRTLCQGCEMEESVRGRRRSAAILDTRFETAAQWLLRAIHAFRQSGRRTGAFSRLASLRLLPSFPSPQRSSSTSVCSSLSPCSGVRNSPASTRQCLRPLLIAATPSPASATRLVFRRPPTP